MNNKIISLLIVFISSLFLVFPAYAATTDISQIDNFLKNIIQILVTIAGSVSVIFFVIGGFNYITSSGNPESLERAKRTIIYAGIGLAITLGAFVLSNIVSEAAKSALGS